MNPENTHHQSSYQLLVQSEKEERSYFESLAYLLLIIAASVSIWQFGHQPVTFTSIGVAAAQRVSALSSSTLRS